MASPKLTFEESLAIVEKQRQERLESTKNFLIGFAKAATTDLPGFLMDVADKLAGDTSYLGEKDRSAQLFEAMTGIKTKSGEGGIDEFLGSLVSPGGALGAVKVLGAGAAKAVIIPARLGPAAAAKNMEAVGKSADEIYQATKIYRDPVTNALKEVIPDTGAAFKPGVLEITEGFKSSDMANNPSIRGELAQSLFDEKQLNDVLDMPEMFALVPQLAQVEVRKPFLGNYSGAFAPSKNTIYLNSGRPNEMLSTALHETQHAIQHSYGMPSGGNPGMFFDNESAVTASVEKAKTARQLLSEEFDKVYKGTPGFKGSNYPSVRLQMMLRDVINDKFPFNKAAAEKFLSALDPQVLQDYTVIGDLDKTITSLKKLDDDAYQSYRLIAGEAQARLVQKQFELQDYTTHPLKLMAEELGVNVDELSKVLIKDPDSVPKLDKTPEVQEAMEFVEKLMQARAAQGKPTK